MSIKHKLNIQTPYKISFSIITAKTPFLNSPLISLCCEFVKGVSCTRTDISTCGDCLVNISAELADIPIGLTDMPVGLTDMPTEFVDMPTEVK